MAYYKCGQVYVSSNSNVEIATASGAIATFNTSLALPLVSLKVEIKPQQASGTPTPSSPLPITGFTGANITHIGINQWDEQWENGEISPTGTVNPSESSICSKNFNRCKPNTTYYFRNTANVAFYDINQTFISRSYIHNNTATTPVNAYYFKFDNRSMATYNIDISINYPSTDTSYHAYTGTTYPISWQTEAGTVYGGYVDWELGKLVIDCQIIDGGDLTWFYQSEYNVFYDKTFTIKDNSTFMLCDIYEFKGSIYRMTDKSCGYIFTKRIAVMDSTYNGDESAFQMAMSGHKFVYQLATPIEIDLPTTMPNTIKTRGGTESIFADCGDVELQYKKIVT